jgi:hypothetical protein
MVMVACHKKGVAMAQTDGSKLCCCIHVMAYSLHIAAQWKELQSLCYVKQGFEVMYWCCSIG